jgi:hypothetical protein
MKSLFLLLAGLLPAAQPAKLVFHYQLAEGEGPSECSQAQIRDLPDWKVSCRTPYGEKTYTAHVVVREYTKEAAAGLEILYWVTEPGATESAPPVFHSTSALLKWRGSGSLEGFSLSQGVENDLASLVLGWKK